MLPSSRPAKLAVECVSPCPLAAGVSAAATALSDIMERASSLTAQCCSAAGLYSHHLSRVSPDSGLSHAPTACIDVIEVENLSVRSNGYLGTDFHHPAGGDLEVVGGV